MKFIRLVDEKIKKLHMVMQNGEIKLAQLKSEINKDSTEFYWKDL